MFQQAGNIGCLGFQLQNKMRSIPKEFSNRRHKVGQMFKCETVHVFTGANAQKPAGRNPGTAFKFIEHIIPVDKQSKKGII